MSKLDVKEGQTYVCQRDDLAWWTLDKEYKVQTFNSGDLCIKDDDETKWYVTNNLMNQVFKLKEQSFDLNDLTVYQLKEYVALQQVLELAENEVQVKLAKKELAQHKLKEFIERMSK